MTPLSRRLIISTVALILALVTLAAVLQLRVTRDGIRDRATGWIETSYPLEVRIGQLDFSLLRLEVRIRDLAISANESPETPFFEAREIAADLDVAALLGRPVIAALDIRDGRIVVGELPGGGSNLPSIAAGPSTGSSGPLPTIENLTIRDLEVIWSKASRDANVTLAGVSADLRTVDGRLSGPLELQGNSLLRVGPNRTTLTQFEGHVRYDGRSLSFEDITIEAPEIRVSAGAAITDLPGVMRLDAVYRAEIEAAQLAPWLGVETPVGGTLAVEGIARGALPRVLTQSRITGGGVTWAGLSGVDLDIDITADHERIEIAALTLEAHDASISGRGRLELGATPRLDGEVSWRDLDTATLARAFPAAGWEQIASTTNGKLVLRDSGLDPDSLDLGLEIVTQPGAGAGTPLTGVARLDARRGRADISVRQSIPQVAELSVRIHSDLDARDWTSSILAGQVDVTASRLDRLAVEPIVVPYLPAALDGIEGAGHAELALTGTAALPSARGTVGATRLRYGNQDLGDLALQLRSGPGRIDLDAITVTLGSNTLNASAVLHPARDELEATFDIRAADLRALQSDRPGPWWPDGQVAITGRATGRLSDPDVEASLTGGPVRIAGQVVDRVAGRIRLARGQLTVDAVQLQQAGARAALDGRYDLQTGQYALNLTGREVALSQLPIEVSGDASLPIDGVVNLDLAGEGSLDAPRVSGRIDFADATVATRRIGSVRMNLTLGDGILAVDAEAPDLSARMQGRLSTDERGDFDVSATLDETDLGWISATPSATAVDGPPHLSGSVAADLRVRGELSSPRHVRAEIDLHRLDAILGLSRLQLVEAGRITLAPDRVTVDRIVLSVDETRATVAGELGGESPEGLGLSVMGDLEDLTPLVEFLQPDGGPPSTMAQGSITLAAVVRGTPADPQFSASFDLDEGMVGDGTLPPATDVRIRARYGPSGLTVNALDATWQGARLAAELQVPNHMLRSTPEPPGAARETRPAGRLSATLQAISAEALVPFLGDDITTRLELAADSSVELTFTGPSLADMAGSLRLTRAEVSVGGARLQQEHPTVARLGDGRLDIIDWDWTAAGNEVSVGGGLDLDRPDGLDVTVRGEVDLRLVGAFLPDLATAGHGSINLRLRGSPTRPLVGGHVTLAGAEIRVATPRLAVTDLDGAVALTNDGIEIVELSGSANGGTLRITGDLEHVGLSVERATLVAEADGVALDFPAGLRSEIDATLSLDTDETASRLTGLVTIERGSYREPLSVTNQLLATLAQEAQTAALTGRRSWMDEVRVDVGVETRENIFVDNNYGRLSLGGTLRVIGTVGRHALAGRASFGEGGVILLGGNVYQLESGSMDFTNPTRIEPGIDIRARTRVSSYDIGLHLSGTPETLETELSSDPTAGQSDIVSLLLTGRTLGEAGNAGSEVARDQVLGYLSGEFAGVAGRAIGLDVLRLDRGATTAEDVRFDAGLVATETNPGSRLTFGKRVSRQLEVIFSQSLQESGDFTWIVDYSPGRQTDLRFVSRDNEDRSYQFWHDLSFGGAGAPGARDATQRPAERVETIGIGGRPGFDEAELVRQLRLSAGDRFDFYHWQEDRDRLLRFYQQHDYLEAQVRTRRVASDQPNTVSIQYDMVRGPRTILVVEGATLSSSLLEEVRARWSRSTFDEFLVQDLTRTTRLHLASQSFVQARVDLTLVANVERDTKTIGVQIETGPAYPLIAINFSGAEQVDVGRLESFVESEGLLKQAFVDPTSLVEAVTGFLRTAGFLDAEVAAHDPVLEDRTATLPFVVREGPLYRLGELAVTNEESRRRGDIRRVLDLSAGSVFSQAALDAARRRLSAHYRRLGFNEVEIAMATDARTSGSVDVLVTIDEGPQHILEDVVVEGAGLTRPGFVNRALGFSIGAPVNLQEWYQARKRLYDTGAFRRVDLEFEPSASGTNTEDPTIEPIRTRVLVEEWPRYRFRYGFQLNDERAPVGESSRTVTPGLLADLVRRNLFGRALTAGVSTRVERRNQTARTFLSMPSLFGLPITSNVFAARSRTEFGDADMPPFVTNDNEVTLEQRFRLGATTRVAYGYNYRRSHTFERDPDPIFPFDITVNTARLTAAVTMDTRDDLLEPTRGWFHSSSVEYASTFLGSDLRFGKYLLQQYYFRPLPGGVVLASAVRAGIVGAYGQDVIPSERFFAGGATSVRGFAEDSLGARDSLGSTRGGETLLILNQEVRFPIVRWLQGVGFLDAGQPFPTRKEFSLGDLDASVGFGFRVRTPFVLIRVDYGQPLSQSAGIRPAGRWVFSIGHMF